MILSDGSIRYHINTGNLNVDPMPEDDAFQPASLELTLGNRFALSWEGEKYEPKTRLVNDADHLKSWTAKAFAERTWTDICIGPNDFMLGHTLETVTIPKFLSAQVNGKSSLGRKGLLVHATAGFIDPGFSGQITLELKNLTKQPIWLKPGIRIAQLVFFMTSRVVDRPYGHPDLHSHYQHQEGATPSYIEGSNGHKADLPRLPIT